MQNLKNELKKLYDEPQLKQVEKCQIDEFIEKYISILDSLFSSCCLCP